MAGSLRDKVEARLRLSFGDPSSPLLLVRVEPKVRLGQLAGIVMAFAAVSVALSAVIAPWVGGVMLIPGAGLCFWWVQRARGGVADSFRAAGAGGWLAVTPSEFVTVRGSGEVVSRIARTRVNSATVVRDHLDIVFEDGSTRNLTIKERKAQRHGLASAVAAAPRFVRAGTDQPASSLRDERRTDHRTLVTVVGLMVAVGAIVSVVAFARGHGGQPSAATRTTPSTAESTVADVVATVGSVSDLLRDAVGSVVPCGPGCASDDHVYTAWTEIATFAKPLAAKLEELEPWPAEISDLAKTTDQQSNAIVLLMDQLDYCLRGSRGQTAPCSFVIEQIDARMQALALILAAWQQQYSV
jgi:hypothetical protein